MSDFGMKVSANGTNVSNASNVQMILTSKNPLAKLDRTNKVSFQNIQIFFAHEPPAPAVGTTNTITTLLYQFPHGYPYTPSIWSFCQAVGVQGQFQGSTTYFEDSGLIGGSNTSVNAPYALIYTGVDATNCYVYITKFTGTIGPQIFVAGSLLNIRFYVFVEDLGM